MILLWSGTRRAFPFLARSEGMLSTTYSPSNSISALLAFVISDIRAPEKALIQVAHFISGSAFNASVNNNLRSRGVKARFADLTVGRVSVAAGSEEIRSFSKANLNSPLITSTWFLTVVLEDLPRR